ncbi:Ig-like domain-containing protein [Holzapfeliella sp. JNUCC 80]
MNKKEQNIIPFLLVFIFLIVTALFCANKNELNAQDQSSRQNYTDSFITQKDIRDQNNKYQSTFNMYDGIRIMWTLKIPSGINQGDTITLSIPDIFRPTENSNFIIFDSTTHQNIARAVTSIDNHTLTLTMNSVPANDEYFITNISLSANWNLNPTETKIISPDTFGNSTNITVNRASSPDSAELLQKWGVV